MEESGCCLEHPSAIRFRRHVLAGEWNKADHDLQELYPMMTATMNNAPAQQTPPPALENNGVHTKATPTTTVSTTSSPGNHSPSSSALSTNNHNSNNNNSHPHIGTGNLLEMRFLLLEQKYLEFLEAGSPLEALHVLRNELTPLHHNTPRVHQLSSYMMCANNEELYLRASWDGKGVNSRSLLMDKLQNFLPPTVMLPPRRLRSLLRQAVEMQTERCAYHDMAWETNLDNVSLLQDHCCAQNDFPLQELQVLNDHCDEVWFCKFSPDGLKLATGSKDTIVIVWDVDPKTNTVKLRRTLDGHTYGVSFITWSPDSKHLIVGGPEDCPDLWIWNIEEDKLKQRMCQSAEDSLTCAAFNADGTRFVTGGVRGQFYLCTLDGTLQDTWDGVRVNGLYFKADNKTVLAADTHNRIRGYCFDNQRTDYTM